MNEVFDGKDWSVDHYFRARKYLFEPNEIPLEMYRSTLGKELAHYIVKQPKFFSVTRDKEFISIEGGIVCFTMQEFREIMINQFKRGQHAGSMFSNPKTM